MTEQVPVFRIKPNNYSNSAMIKYVGNINSDEKLQDNIIELDNNTNTLSIKKIGEYEMTGRLYRCNIVGSHILISNRYPVLYLDISYERPMVSGSLFQIFFSIDIDKEYKNEIKEKKKVVNFSFNGTWCMHIDCDDELKEYCETIQDKDTRDYYESLIKDNKTLNFRKVSDIKKYLIDLCSSEKFYDFLVKAMKCRELHRRKEYGIEEAYVVPEKVTKLSDISDELIRNNEIIMYDD